MAERAPFRDVFKTKLCKLFTHTGVCPRANCSFAHGEEELRQQPPLFRGPEENVGYRAGDIRDNGVLDLPEWNGEPVVFIPSHSPPRDGLLRAPDLRRSPPWRARSRSFSPNRRRPPLISPRGDGPWNGRNRSGRAPPFPHPRRDPERSPPSDRYGEASSVYDEEKVDIARQRRENVAEVRDLEDKKLLLDDKIESLMEQRRVVESQLYFKRKSIAALEERWEMRTKDLERDSHRRGWGPDSRAGRKAGSARSPPPLFDNHYGP
eukprot:TRINITY_DN21084_c0_g1_i1.p1 TRINITY_DN21084_c0_g1~~TRINITY_DN21084_c0_g1_i1.p1  ORF type:complete len:264 (-),score=32.99 TRINITY_DN21084_c0_g1_i1:455-1246(-)